MAKILRLIFKKGVSDYDGRLAEYRYKTLDVVVPVDADFADNWPEVIGAEWLPDAEEGGRLGRQC